MPISTEIGGLAGARNKPAFGQRGEKKRVEDENIVGGGVGAIVDPFARFGRRVAEGHGDAAVHGGHV